MKTFKNLFAYSAIFALLATMMPMHVNAASYDAELVEAYAYAHNKGITTMSTIENADMMGSLSRIAMAKMVANYVLDLDLQDLDESKDCTFPDVSEALDTQYDNGVTKACQLGLMGVGIEKFNPNGIVTRAEFGTVLSRALWGDENNGGDPYYKNHLNALKDAGIMTKIDNPEMKEVRGYVMIMMQRADDAYIPAVGCSAEELLACILADDYESCIAACSGTEEEEVVLPGFATVSRVGSVDNQYVPKNAINVKVGTVKITAGENDTTVSSVEITRFGLATIDTNEVKLVLRNNSVESRDAFVNKTTNKASVKFSPALELKARSSMTFDLVVSIEGNLTTLNANNIHGFRVTDVVVANGTSTGTPVELGTIKTTSAESKTVTVDVKNGETSLKAGENNKVIAKVNFDFNQAGGVINGFSLLQTGVSADKTRINEIFENAKVFVDEKEVGTAVISKDKIIVSDLNIAKDRTEDVDVEIRANAIFVGNTTSMKLKLENLFAKEGDSGYGMTYGAANIVETPTLISVKGYDIKLKKVNIEKDVLESTKKALLYEATLTSATDITLKDINLNGVLSAGDFDSAFDDGTLVLNIAGEEFIVNSLTYTQTNIDTPVSANRAITIKVYGNLKKDFVGDITFTFKSDAEDLEDNPIAAFNEKGTKVSVNKATADVKKIAATATNKKIFSQGNDQEVGRFSIKAKQDNLKLKELKVKSLKEVKDLSDVKIDLSDVLNNPKLLVDGKEVDATISFDDAADIISFTSMDYEVKKDETVKFMLVADFDDTTLFASASEIQFQVLATTLLKNSRGNAVTVVAENLDVYSFGNQSPKVVVTAIEGINPKFAITITNNDIDNPLTLSTIEVNTQASNDYNVGTLCIVDSDEVSDCSDSSHLVAREVSGSDFAAGFPAKKTLTFADAAGKILTDGDAVPVEQLDKNGGEVTYYVIIESGLTPEFVIFNVNKINAFNKSESVTFTPSFLNQ